MSIYGLVISFCMASAVAHAQETPREFISALTGDLLTSVAAPSLSDQERDRNFRAIFRRAFHVAEVSQSVLGRYWRTATPEQREEFAAVFEEFIALTWSRRFKDYGGDGQGIVLGDTAPVGEADTVLSSHVDRPGQAPLQVEWLLRRDDGRYHVLDIKVEGASMLATYRSEYQSILRNGGIPALITLLRRKIQQAAAG